MPLTLELPGELADTRTGDAAKLEKKNEAELVAYWQSENLFGSRTDIVDSQQCARTARERAEQRSK